MLKFLNHPTGIFISRRNFRIVLFFLICICISFVVSGYILKKSASEIKNNLAKRDSFLTTFNQIPTAKIDKQEKTAINRIYTVNVVVKKFILKEYYRIKDRPNETTDEGNIIGQETIYYPLRGYKIIIQDIEGDIISVNKNELTEVDKDGGYKYPEYSGALKLNLTQEEFDLLNKESENILITKNGITQKPKSVFLSRDESTGISQLEIEISSVMIIYLKPEDPLPEGLIPNNLMEVEPDTIK